MAHQDFLTLCKDRGFFHQCTDLEALGALLSREKAVPAYIGFDCTAPSLHVGSLMQIMLLRWYQKCGHKPIVLMGGGTTKVGDPSGKAEDRPLLNDENIAKNMAGIRKVFGQFLTFGEQPADALMVNNADWLAELNYIDFLRDYGRHFSVNRMLAMDSVKLRIEREQHLSFLEFNYMILQAYDFVELNKRLGCRLQIGGSDQWGNIIQGVELHRKKNIRLGDLLTSNEYILQARGSIDQIFGLTTPLLTTASGAKMGKTASGAIWLDADLLSPYDYWQYWRNTEDADVGRFLKLFTELPLDEIAKLEALQGAEINEAKKVLANEATALLHGREAAEAAAATAHATFVAGGAGESLPRIEIPKAELEKGIPAHALFVRAGLATSGGEARRLIRGGGAKINDVAVEDENRVFTLADFADDSSKLSAGKKHHVKISLIP